MDIKACCGIRGRFRKLAFSGSSAGCFVSVLACAAWRKIRPKAFLSLWGMVNTTDTWYCTKKQDDAVVMFLPLSKLEDKNYIALLEPGKPRVWDDRTPPTDLSSRGAFFFWLLKEGKIGPLINESFNGLYQPTGKEKLLDLVTSSFPPTVCVHGSADSVAPVSDSHAMVDALKKVGVKAELIEIAGADHGILPQERYLEYFEKSVEFLERS